MNMKKNEYLDLLLESFPEAKKIQGLQEPYERNINLGKCARMISKNDLAKSDLDSTLDICIPIHGWSITNGCKISNLPLKLEKSLMQCYHFNYSQEDLKTMVTSPKILFDRYHQNFLFDGELVSKSYFFMISPQAINEDLPIIYRMSVARYVDDPVHYSISMHAIVGGRVDGWLFLARLDNNNKNEHIIKPEQPILKTNDDIMNLKNLTPTKNLREEHKFKTIAYPHLHRADASYEPGIQPEKLVPVHLDKCVNNTISQNIAYLMNLFKIQNKPMFQETDITIEKLIEKVEKEFINNNSNTTPDSTEIIKSIVQMELEHQREIENNSEKIVKEFHKHHKSQQANYRCNHKNQCHTPR